MNPTAPGESRVPVILTPDTPSHPVGSASIRDAIVAASQLASSEGSAFGVFQAMGRGQDQGYFLAGLSSVNADTTTTPLAFEHSPPGPVGGPVTDRFELTLEGSGAADGPVLQAIVGASTFASFGNGKDAPIQPLAALHA